jgi:DNA-binding transcriptional regulator YiaG
MTKKSSTKKLPKLQFTTGEEVQALRRRLSLNQSQFWSRIAVTQSGGSRYESGRKIPLPVQYLLHLAYGPEAKAQEMLTYLRQQQPTESA